MFSNEEKVQQRMTNEMLLAKQILGNDNRPIITSHIMYARLVVDLARVNFTSQLLLFIIVYGVCKRMSLWYEWPLINQNHRA